MMNDETPRRLGDYYREAESWSADRERAHGRSERRAWIVAGIAGGVALLEAIAIIVMMPLKTIEPYTLLVDRQTGYVQALRPLERETIAPDAALTRSFLAQYVIAREGFDIDSLREDYRKVALWSAGDARNRYLAQMQANNPMSPLATLPRSALVEVQLRSISSLGADTAFVRFTTARSDPGGQGEPPQTWAAVIKYRFSSASMSAADRLTNPLGFQVLRYARNPEVAPEPHIAAPAEGQPIAIASGRPASLPMGPPPRRSDP
jgi:type IV secretion system protein VirB8